MAFYEVKQEYRQNLMLQDDSGNRVTYTDFENFLERAGEELEPRSLMAIFCENSIGSVFFYLACLNRKLVPILLDKNMDAQLAKGLLENYRPQYIAMPQEDFPAKAEVLAAEIRTAGMSAGEFMVREQLVQDYGYEVWQVGTGQSDADSLNVRRPVFPALHDLHPDLALLLTTSGSTGSPKLVRQSYQNIDSNAKAIAGYLELDETERPITVLPMNYTYGLSIINSHMRVGATVLLTKRTLFEPEFWTFFKEAGATSVSGVPYTYEMLKRLRFLQMDLPSLRTMTQAGGKLSEKLHREFAEYAQETDRKFIVMYGQTEATARMGYLPAEMALKKCGSMGIAIPGGKFTLIDVENQEITEPDIVGELVYEGSNVTLGYASCLEDLAKGDERGGILQTGDMAKRDADGYYYITGRKKRFLKMFGKRVNMDEIERLIRAQYDGIGAACTGEDDHLKVFVECAEKTDDPSENVQMEKPAKNAAECQEFCAAAAAWLSGKTGIHLSGIEVLPIAEIPKNSAGKILYSALQ